MNLSWSPTEESKIQDLLASLDPKEIPRGCTARSEAVRKLQRLKKAGKWPEKENRSAKSNNKD